MRIVGTLCVALTLLLPWREAREPQGTPPTQFLFVWAGAVDPKQTDFLAVIDATPAVPRYGSVIATVPVGAVTGAHHAEWASERILLANGFTAGATFRFDVTNPRKPMLVGALAVPDGIAHPHSFVRLANGNVLATYQMQASDHSQAGGIAEHDAKGAVVRWKSAIDPAARDQLVRPYSLVTMPAIDRVVTTGADMHLKGESRVVQVWRLSDLRLIRSIVLPDGPRGREAGQTLEPRLLADGRTVVVSTLNCGLYRIDKLETEEPSAALLHTFDDQRCDMPVVSGRYWVQTLSTTNALVVLDMSDAARPMEISRLDLGADNRPHWVSLEPGGNRIVVTGYRDMQHRVLMLRIDPGTGHLSVDSAFREDGASEPGLDFNRATWPHGATGPARPHGALFGPPAASLPPRNAPSRRAAG